ncbi:MAG: class I SAM-dependent methyltransferase [Lutisporaceae bacterium]
MNKITRETILKKIVEIGLRPNLPKDSLIEDCKNYKYKIDRNIYEYLKFMPELGKCLKKDSIVLEIGVGSGIAAQQIQKKYGCKLTGTGLQKPQHCNFDFEIATANELPFQSNTFDIVISMHGISWEPNQKEALKEVIRVLKPNGIAHIYLIRFSHSIALFYGNDFWKDLEIEPKDIHLNEFNSLAEFDGVQMELYENEFPDEICEGHYKEWYLIIRKPSDSLAKDI